MNVEMLKRYLDTRNEDEEICVIEIDLNLQEVIRPAYSLRSTVINDKSVIVIE